MKNNNYQRCYQDIDKCQFLNCKKTYWSILIHLIRTTLLLLNDLFIKIQHIRFKSIEKNNFDRDTNNRTYPVQNVLVTNKKLQ